MAFVGDSRRPERKVSLAIKLGSTCACFLLAYLSPRVRFGFGCFLLEGFFVHVVLLFGLWKECIEHELQLFAHRFIQLSLRLFLAGVVFPFLRSLGRFGRGCFLREPSHPFVHVSQILPRSLLHRTHAFQRASTPHRARRLGRGPFATWIHLLGFAVRFRKETGVQWNPKLEREFLWKAKNVGARNNSPCRFGCEPVVKRAWRWWSKLVRGGMAKEERVMASAKPWTWTNVTKTNV